MESLDSSTFYVSNFDKGDLISIASAPIKTNEYGFYSYKSDTCVLGIVDPLTKPNSGKSFDNLFFLHRGESEKRIETTNLADKIVIGLKVIESTFVLQSPYFLALTSDN